MSNPKWHIDRYIAKQETKAESALKIVSFWLAGQSKRLAPTITSRLKDSISSSVGNQSPQGIGSKASAKDGVPSPNDNLVAWIGTSVEYAPYVEFGTVHQAEQSYLRKSIMENKDKIQKFFSRNMK